MRGRWRSGEHGAWRRLHRAAFPPPPQRSTRWCLVEAATRPAPGCAAWGGGGGAGTGLDPLLARFFAAQGDGVRQAGYAGTTIHRLDVRPLNARAACIAGVFSRHTRAGQELPRFGTVYRVVKPAERWRCSSLIMTDA